MEKISGVYLIKNKLNGKGYVGSSSNIIKRWSTHKSPSTWVNIKSDLYKDFQEYGLENFDFIILEKCDVSELRMKERFYMESLGTIEKGYNKLVSYRPEVEAKIRYKVYKDEYNKEHSKEHTLYMRNYRKEHIA